MGNHIERGAWISIGEASRRLCVSPQSVRNYANCGEIEFRFTVGGHRRISVASLNRYLGLDDETEKGGRKTVIYARVSTNFQRKSGNLERQKQRLFEYCESELGCRKGDVIFLEDVGSGLSDGRKNFIRLISVVLAGDAERVVVEYLDRISRGSNAVFSMICSQMGTEIISTKAKDDVSHEEEMAADIMSLVTVYSARLHGKRGGDSNKLSIPEEAKARILGLHTLGLAQSNILKTIQSEGHTCERTGRKLGIHAIRLVLLEQEKIRAVFEEKTTTTPIEQFISENCIRAKDERCFTRPFHRQYELWAKSQGFEGIPTSNALTRAVKKIGFESGRTGSGFSYFIGLKLKDNERASRSHLG